MTLIIQEVKRLSQEALSFLETALSTEVPVGANHFMTSVNANYHFKEPSKYYWDLNVMIYDGAPNLYSERSRKGKKIILTDTEPKVGRIAIACRLALEFIPNYTSTFFSGFTHIPQDLDTLRKKCIVKAYTEDGKVGYLIGRLTRYSKELGLQRNKEEIIRLMHRFS